ncbi:hypothetical protein NSA52_09040 [Clostridium sporogenes]|uniref:hypothetical protein n=1 Tax=Clostridium sporogenes TaxID=1509 RepID=UPI00214A4EF2|nr:hypothetical protein [Clostridium sporogenes]MCR1974274.1 hypothetical protein [Clostridium sporogenes]
MSKVYLFARKVGIGGTAVLETTIKDAVGVMKNNRKPSFQLGILNGPSYSSLIKVYGEYAPFRKVHNVDELIKSVEIQ